MTPSNNTIIGLAGILGLIINVYMWIVIIRVLISWVSPNPRNPVVKLLARVTDPVLYHVRRLAPLSFSGIDFSPVILILLLVFVHDFVISTLIGIGRGMPISGVLPLFLKSFIRLIQGILYAYLIVVIVRVILSWISPDPYNPIVRVVYAATEPVLYRLRRLIPLTYAGIDFSPIALATVIYLISYLLDLWLVEIMRPFFS